MLCLCLRQCLTAPRLWLGVYFVFVCIVYSSFHSVCFSRSFNQNAIKKKKKKKLTAGAEKTMHSTFSIIIQVASHCKRMLYSYLRNYSVLSRTLCNLNSSNNTNLKFKSLTRPPRHHFRRANCSGDSWHTTGSGRCLSYTVRALKRVGMLSQGGIGIRVQVRDSESCNTVAH